MNDEGQNCVALWRAVIERAVSDLKPPKKNWRSWEKKNKNVRLANIGTYYRTLKWVKGKDFEEVCILADLNIEYTRDFVIKHALNTYNLMPRHLKKKLKGVF